MVCGLKQMKRYMIDLAQPLCVCVCVCIRLLLHYCRSFATSSKKASLSTSSTGAALPLLPPVCLTWDLILLFSDTRNSVKLPICAYLDLHQPAAPQELTQMSALTGVPPVSITAWAHWAEAGYRVVHVLIIVSFRGSLVANRYKSRIHWAAKSPQKCC